MNRQVDGAEQRIARVGNHRNFLGQRGFEAVKYALNGDRLFRGGRERRHPGVTTWRQGIAFAQRGIIQSVQKGGQIDTGVLMPTNADGVCLRLNHA